MRFVFRILHPQFVCISYDDNAFFIFFRYLWSQSYIVRKYKRNIGAVLLLVLFAWYWSSVTLFPHAHNIDGHIYVHSHPFSGTSNNPGHSHTPQQFQLIAHLSLLVMMVATLVAFALRLLGVSFIFKTQKPAVRQDAPIRIYGLRAPPVC